MIYGTKTLADEPLDKRMELGLQIMISAVEKVKALGLVPRFRQSTQARVIHVANLEVGLVGPGSRPGHKNVKIRPKLIELEKERLIAVA